MNSPLVPSVIGNELKVRTLSFQNYRLLTVQSVRDIFTTTRYFTDLVTQMDLIGVGSLLIVVVASFCVGGVVVMNSASQFNRFGETVLTGDAVSLALLRELGPVFTALLAAGRNATGFLKLRLNRPKTARVQPDDFSCDQRQFCYLRRVCLLRNLSL